MKPKAIIFDIDGVLSEKYQNRQWREENKVHLDAPIFQIQEIFSNLLKSTSYKIFSLTGRTEACREKTIAWLNTHYLRDSNNANEYSLLMRHIDDWRKGFEVKRDMFEFQVKDKYGVIFAIDDDPEICKMHKEHSIFTLEVKRSLNDK